jgi:hypothetical protein
VARVQAQRTGTSVGEAWDSLWAGARYEGRAPSPDELLSGAYAQLGEGATPPWHEIPGEKVRRNLKAKLQPNTNRVNASKPTHDVVSPLNGQRVLGQPTFHEWINRVIHATPDVRQQILDATWYERLAPAFQEIFGDGYEPVLRAFGASQANAGPRGGMVSVLRAIERVERGADVKQSYGSVGSVVADQIERAYRGVTLTHGQAAKLSDFIDAIRGMKTRSWMGHDPLAGMPAPSDIWSARDAGFLDKKLVTRTHHHNYIVERHGVNLRDLQPDMVGAPSGYKYERISQMYNDFADELNKISYHGRTNWTPAQAQAMGWASMQRFFGRPITDISEWINSGRAAASKTIQRDQQIEAGLALEGEHGVHVVPGTRAEIMRMEPNADYLYHGTDEKGMHGILSSGRIEARPTERNPEQPAAWLTENPGRAAAQGRHVIAVPRENLLKSGLQAHPLGMHSSPEDVHIFGNPLDTTTAQVHSESVPQPDLHPALNERYNALSPEQKVEYSAAADRVALGAHFESIVGADRVGSHFGVGVWRGEENPGLAAHVHVEKLTPEEVTKMNAVASAYGMAKHQGSVSWGRPLSLHARTGDNVFPAVLAHVRATGDVGALVDKTFGNGMVGVIHGPADTTYLVDFSGEIDNFRARAGEILGGDVHPIKWQGGYTIDERLKTEDWETTFQDAINSAPNSDMLKNAIEHANGVISKIGDRVFAQPGLEAQKTYDGMLRSILDARGLKDDAAHLTKADRDAAEEILHSWADDNPNNPLAQQFKALTEAAQSARNSLDPEHYFTEGNTLFGSMKRAQGFTQMLRQDANERVVKGMVTRSEDMQHFLTLFKGADVSTVLHELAHAVEKYLPDMGLAPEELARSVEQYFLLGVSPNEVLKEPMRAIAKDLSEIYHAQNVPGQSFNPQVGEALDRMLTGAADPKLEAAAMQVSYGGMTPEAAATMFGIEPRTLRQHIENGAHALEQKRIVSNAQLDERYGAAKTTESADDILKRNLFQEGYGEGVGWPAGPEDEWGANKQSLPELVMADAREWVRDTFPTEIGHDDAVDEASDKLILRMVEKHYDGGMEQFIRDGHYDHGIETTTPVRDLTGATKADRALVDDIRNAKPEDFFFQEDTPEVPPEDLARLDPENLGSTYKPVSDTTPEQQLREGLKGARSVYGKQRAARRLETDQRLERAGKAMAENTQDPDAAMAAFKAEMRGPYVQIDFHGLKELDPAALRYFKQHVLEHPGLKPFQKLRINEALDKAVFEGRVPRPAELREIERVFGPMNARSINHVAEQGGWDKFFNFLNVPRSLMATADLSAGLRQALVAGASHPILWGKAWPAYIKAVKSGKNYEVIMQSIKDDPWYTHALAGGVSFTDVGAESALAAHEEAFASDYAARIPGIGHAVKGSSRGYTAFLNKIRMDAFAQQMRIAAKAGRSLDNERFLTKIADVVNASTGRGTIHGRLEHILPALNTMLFSPRLMLSRINYLDPTWYIRLGHDLPPAEAKQVRIEALRGLFTTVGAVMGTLTLVSQIPGVKVELDPTSSDFGKAHFGNTRIDIAGGFQQYVHLAGMLIENAKKSPNSGIKKTFDGSFGSSSRWDEIQNFVYNKFAPVPGMIRDVAKGHDNVGNSLGAYDWKEVATHFTPLVGQDSLDLFNDRKRGLNGIAWALGGYGLGAVGVGLQTFSPKDPASKPTKRLQDEAKKAGVTVPKDVLTAEDHKAHLDSISHNYSGNPQKKLDETIKYYAETTGDHQWDHLIGQDGITDTQAEQGIKNFRRALIGSGLSGYEKRLKSAAEAKK